jgi:hypothetical protein
MGDTYNIQQYFLLGSVFLFSYIMGQKTMLGTMASFFSWKLPSVEPAFGEYDGCSSARATVTERPENGVEGGQNSESTQKQTMLLFIYCCSVQLPRLVASLAEQVNGDGERSDHTLAVGDGERG